MNDESQIDRDDLRTAPGRQDNRDAAENLPLDVPPGDEVPFHVPRD